METEHTFARDGLQPRVEQLETSVASLHQDSIRTQSALAALAGQVDGLSDTLRDIADKLDAQRTRRPEMGALATWAIVILTIGALAFAPISSRLSNLENVAYKGADIMMERAEVIGSATSELAEHGARIDRLERQLDNERN